MNGATYRTSPLPSFPPLPLDYPANGAKGMETEEWSGYKDPSRGKKGRSRLGDAAYATSGPFGMSSSLGSLGMEGRQNPQSRSAKRMFLIEDLGNVPVKCTKCEDNEAKRHDAQKKYSMEIENLRQAIKKCLDALMGYMSGNQYNAFSQGLQLEVRFFSKDEEPAKPPPRLESPTSTSPRSPKAGNSGKVKELNEQILQLEDDIAVLERKNLALQEQIDKMPKPLTGGRSRSKEAERKIVRTTDNIAQTTQTGELKPVVQYVEKVVEREIQAPAPGGGGRGGSNKAGGGSKPVQDNKKKKPAKKPPSGKKEEESDEEEEEESEEEESDEEEDDPPPKKKPAAKKKGEPKKKPKAKPKKKGAEAKGAEAKKSDSDDSDDDSDDDDEENGRLKEELEKMKGERDWANIKAKKLEKELREMEDMRNLLQRQINDNAAVKNLKKELEELRAQIEALKARTVKRGDQEGEDDAEAGGDGEKKKKKQGNKEKGDGTRSSGDGTRSSGDGRPLNREADGGGSSDVDEQRRTQSAGRSPEDSKTETDQGFTQPSGAAVDGASAIADVRSPVQQGASAADPLGTNRGASPQEKRLQVETASIGVGPGPGFPQEKEMPSFLSGSSPVAKPKPEVPLSGKDTVCLKRERTQPNLSSLMETSGALNQQPAKEIPATAPPSQPIKKLQRAKTAALMSGAMNQGRAERSLTGGFHIARAATPELLGGVPPTLLPAANKTWHAGGKSQGPKAEPYILNVWEQERQGKRRDSLKRELINLGAVSPNGTMRRSTSIGTDSGRITPEGCVRTESQQTIKASPTEPTTALAATTEGEAAGAPAAEGVPPTVPDADANAKGEVPADDSGMGDAGIGPA